MSTPTAVVIAQCDKWIRIAITVNTYIKEELLIILHNPINGLPKDPKKLYAVLLAFKQTHQKKLKNIIKDFQWDKLCHVCDHTCPAGCSRNGTTDSSTFDVTLIVILIINFNLVAPPRNGWRKALDPLDTSRGAFVIRSRDLRNLLNHSTTDDLNKNFTKHWNEAECILVGFGSKNLSSFRALEKKSLDPDTVQRIDDLCKGVDGMLTIKNNEIVINQQVNKIMVELQTL